MFVLRNCAALMLDCFTCRHSKDKKTGVQDLVETSKEVVEEAVRSIPVSACFHLVSDCEVLA